MMLRLGLLLLTCLCLYAQRPEFDFYQQARSKPPDVYAEELRAAGVPEQEIARRLDLLRNHRTELETDRWDRFYSDENSNYNLEPNRFLVEVVQTMKPGVVLDYAMGDGRNSIYLAELGWEVHGFDPSKVAVNKAKQRASELGLDIDAVVSSDADYDFGQDRFDMILFSWSMPLIDVHKVIDALKRGGIVVMEFDPSFTGKNGMLHLFDDLVIESYEHAQDISDFSDRRKTDVFRLIARKDPSAE